ncbi:pyruvate formate lyase family protein [Ensifer sp. BR816]|uniref:pyruvate formate lyase family protein n=1 Tax=Rhizobium sp. (strain BR816) TaxID=1057002 RepID=UPI00035F4FA3|nr:pyruvate formate lyase family protein [Ensifer sp. BR816]
MHHNILAYWRHLQNLPAGHKDLPSPRVNRLMLNMFEGWRGQQVFPSFGSLGHIRDHDGEGVMELTLVERRGLAMARTLELISSSWGHDRGVFKIDPDELIVGTMPPYSVGQGKEVMDYFKDDRDDRDERLEFEARFLNQWSNFGHICPNHEKVTRRGLRAIIDECVASRDTCTDPERKSFYTSVATVLESVIVFANNYAAAAEGQAELYRRVLQEKPNHPQSAVFRDRVDGMSAAAERLRRIPAEPCESFTDAVQCIFLMNCALHWTGELTSLGRLDQILQPFLKAEELKTGAAQVVIDCLWVKLDQRVTLDNRMIVDHFSQADGALMGAGGASNFDQGALTNQWMQQLTIGGLIADNEAEPKDACNDVTRLCLHAARRFPFNCPTLDLRVHKHTPGDVIDLAARALLSGGAHPVLLNDDKLVPALLRAGAGVELKSARNYACDGCYETIFPGETEFSFIYVPGVDVLEKALNSGAGFGASGSTFLRGMKGSYRSSPANEIAGFEDFLAIMEEHIWLNVNRQIAGFLSAYGAKGAVCPSPILSAMVDGCLESGRDFYDGGARYHMFAPLMTGISTVADSLYVLEKLVFGEQVIALDELVACLRSDWGARSDVVGRKVTPERVAELRALCLAQPRFGHGNKLVDRHAWRLIDSFVDSIERALKQPMHAAALARLESRFASPGKPFNLVVTPGVGTFEQYNFGGSFGGATPDGRRAGAPLASDLSASPYPQDLELPGATPIPSMTRAFASWNHRAVTRLADGAPSDFNIAEDSSPEALTKAIRTFADGQGSNVMTVTTANPATLAAAEAAPGDYDLVRVRMGGWTEFFVVLFSDHKRHHRRRPVYPV